MIRRRENRKQVKFCQTESWIKTQESFLPIQFYQESFLPIQFYQEFFLPIQFYQESFLPIQYSHFLLTSTFSFPFRKPSLTPSYHLMITFLTLTFHILIPSTSPTSTLSYSSLSLSLLHTLYLLHLLFTPSFLLPLLIYNI